MPEGRANEINVTPKMLYSAANQIDQGLSYAGFDNPEVLKMKREMTNGSNTPFTDILN